MKKVLFLDDDDQRINIFLENLIDTFDITVVKTSRDAVNKLSKLKYDYICLDHDLGGQVYQKSGIGTGYEVACFIHDNDIKYERIFIHSWNRAGAENMFSKLSEAIYYPFCKEYCLLLRNLCTLDSLEAEEVSQESKESLLIFG